jgi:hypothetical protein
MRERLPSSQYVAQQVDTAAFPHRSEGVGAHASSTIGTGRPLLDVRLDQTPRARRAHAGPGASSSASAGNLVVIEVDAA